MQHASCRAPSKKLACLKASIQQVEGRGGALLVDHELETQADSMATEDCKYARGEPVVPPVEFAATLFLNDSVSVTSEGRQPSQDWEGGHVDMGSFSFRTETALLGICMNEVASALIDYGIPGRP